MLTPETGTAIELSTMTACQWSLLNGRPSVLDAHRTLTQTSGCHCKPWQLQDASEALRLQIRSVVSHLRKDQALSTSVCELDVKWQRGQAAGLKNGTKIVLHGSKVVTAGL